KKHGQIMHLSRSIAAAAAACALAATMPQLAQAREIVGFSGSYSSGTVVVKTNERALYYVLGNGKAVRYPVGVGRVGKQWTGTAYISSKQLRHPGSIGGFVSYGCIRMHNADVLDLYNRVGWGTTVVVTR